MKFRSVLPSMMILCLFFPALGGTVWGSTPAKGDVFPALTLPAPEKQSEREYLGITGKDPFSLERMKGDIVVLEIFSMYCPYCQKEAPNVNELYRAISNKPGLGDKIKIIGIGAGNTPFEVNVFRNTYNIPFPLFSDESFSIHKKVGEVRTPYFFVVKINEDGSNNIIYSSVGSIRDPEEFLKMILKEAGIQ